MDTFAEKIFSIKEKREIGLLSKRGAYNSAEGAEEERLFNNRYLFGHDGNIGVIDLISLYYRELNLFSGSTTSKPNLNNNSNYSAWHNKFKLAVSNTGDGNNPDSFYRLDSSIPGDIAEMFLNDGGSYENLAKTTTNTPGSDWFFNNGYSAANSNYYPDLENLDYEAGEEALTPIEATGNITPTITLEGGTGYVSHALPPDASWYSDSATAETDAQTIIAATKAGRQLLGKRTNRENYYIEERTYQATEELCPGDPGYVDPGAGECYTSTPFPVTVYRFVIEDEITFPDVYEASDKAIILGVIDVIRNDLEEYRNYLRDSLNPELEKIRDGNNVLFEESQMSGDVYESSVQTIIDNIGDKTDADALDPTDSAAYSIQSRLNFFRTYFSLANKELDINLSAITDPHGELLGDYFLLYYNGITNYIWFGEDGNESLDPGATASTVTVETGTTESNLNGKYFLLNSTLKSYYIWFNDTSDDTPATDPAPAGVDFGIHVDMNVAGTIPELTASAISNASFVDSDITYDEFFAEVDSVDSSIINIYSVVSGIVTTHVADGDINSGTTYLTYGNQAIRAGLDHPPTRIDLLVADTVNDLGTKIASALSPKLVSAATYTSNVVSLVYYPGDYADPIDGPVGYETNFTFTEIVGGQVYDRDEFNDYLNNVNATNNISLVEFEAEITTFFNNRRTNVINNCLSNTSTPTDTAPAGIRKWLHFWISEQIKKYQSPYMSLVGMNLSFENAENEISKSESTLETLLSDVPVNERRLQYFNSPEMIAAYQNPILNEDTGEINQQRIGLAWIGSPAANNYKIYKKEIARDEVLTNDNWTLFDTEEWIDDYNEDSMMLNTQLTTSDVVQGKVYAFRVQTFDVDNTGDYSTAPGFALFNKPILLSSQFDFFGGSLLSNIGRAGSFNSGSLQSNILGETYSFDSIVNGVVTMPEEHEFIVNQFIYYNNKLYKIIEITETTFTIDESINAAPGTFEITKGIIEA